MTALKELMAGATGVSYDDVRGLYIESVAGHSMRVILHSAPVGWALLRGLRRLSNEGSRDFQAFRVTEAIAD